MKELHGPQHLAPNYIWYQIVGVLISIAVILLVVLPGLIMASIFGAATSDPIGMFVGMGVAGGVFLIVIISMVIKLFLVKIAYKRFTYELKEDVFAQQEGVLNVTSVIIPYDRIQDVVIQRPFIMRWFGLSRLNIQNASGGTSYGMNSGTALPGLDKDVAEKLQAELIERSKRARSQLMHGGAL